MGANGLHPSHAAFEPTREFKHTFNGSHPNNDPIAAREAQIKKTLLLNAYPIAYVVLWLPGIANRIAEATGHPTVVLLIMQSTTQLVGLANAISESPISPLTLLTVQPLDSMNRLCAN